MNGVDLITSINLFGFKDGFPFWFRWNFIDPIKMWYWMNISHKPYCLEYGFFLEKEGCAAPKLYTKKEIKEHWKKISEEEFGGYY